LTKVVLFERMKSMTEIIRRAAPPTTRTAPLKPSCEIDQDEFGWALTHRDIVRVEQRERSPFRKEKIFYLAVKGSQTPIEAVSVVSAYHAFRGHIAFGRKYQSRFYAYHRLEE
jgi:hypothetical protein